MTNVLNIYGRVDEHTRIVKITDINNLKIDSCGLFIYYDQKEDDYRCIKRLIDRENLHSNYEFVDGYVLNSNKYLHVFINSFKPIICKISGRKLTDLFNDQIHLRKDDIKKVLKLTDELYSQYLKWEVEANIIYNESTKLIDKYERLLINAHENVLYKNNTTNDILYNMTCKEDKIENLLTYIRASRPIFEKIKRDEDLKSLELINFGLNLVK